MGCTRVTGPLLALSLLAVAAPATAHDSDCVDRLLTSPTEELELPADWSVSHASVSPDGALNLSLSGPIVGEWEYSGDPKHATINLSATCAASGEAYIEAVARLDDLAGRREVAAIRIGDLSHATRESHDSGSSTSQLVWTRDGLVALATYFLGVDEEPVHWPDIEDIALAFDAALPR